MCMQVNMKKGEPQTYLSDHPARKKATGHSERKAFESQKREIVTCELQEWASSIYLLLSIESILGAGEKGKHGLRGWVSSPPNKSILEEREREVNGILCFFFLLLRLTVTIGQKRLIVTRAAKGCQEMQRAEDMFLASDGKRC
ncbi:hypothetical protein SAY86_010099 [Trapa natans]|uniref:Uncharacterized protein n=1 Tax=Trapa natans TaxID=22666 RepID=A0AAN7KZQ5_TRANT|nr:hypothetical protein SAY86_010099 [Trapa natans]